MAKLLDPSIIRALLDAIPNGIVLMDNRRIEWVNNALAKALGITEDKLIGLDSGNAGHLSLDPIFEESDRFYLSDSQGRCVWFSRQRMDLEQGCLELHMLTDIHRQVELENKLERLAKDLEDMQPNHPVTGLLNRRAILQALDTQVSRSRRYENPLVLLRLSLKSSRPASEMSESLKRISRMLKDSLRWADQIGMIDDCTFLIILPETSLGAAKELAIKLANERTNLGEHPEDWSIGFAAAAWQKGDDRRKLLSRLQVEQPLDPVARLP
ncbi:MAG: diguanylate cyclase [Methylococcaceae bacterium]|nr:diguanylate cyclase [Methylococcaceae bacterium]